MERLTEKILGNVQLKDCGNNFCKETCAEYDEEKSCDNCPIQKAFEKLAEYEELEEKGRLLRLPCAVGDTYYCIDDCTYPNEWEFINVQQIISCMDKIGKTVFLTRQEAEDKPAETEGKK